MKKTIFDKIRDTQREDRIKGVRRTHIILSPVQYEELIDYYLRQSNKHSGFFGSEYRVLGFDIIIGEESICRIDK